MEPEASSDLFSRNSGLLETTALQQSGVIVCVCGSVGSLAALELARSGVGRFLLIDPELLAIENLCRHQCGLADVGRRKVQGVADRIRQINPQAVVQSEHLPLEQLDPAVVARFCEANADTLMLACADSRRADQHASRLAAALSLPFLAIGLWERAFAGEIFYSHPGEPMPCFTAVPLTGWPGSSPPGPSRCGVSTAMKPCSRSFISSPALPLISPSLRRSA